MCVFVLSLRYIKAILILKLQCLVETFETTLYLIDFLQDVLSVLAILGIQRMYM